MANDVAIEVPHPEYARRRGRGSLAGEIVREALVGLMRNRSRALLSMLGISWGIVSVVMLLAYGEGFNQALIRGFQGAFGDGVSLLFGGQTSMQAGGERAGHVVRFRLEDAQAVGRLDERGQRSVVLAIVRREIGVMALAALVVAFLALRAYGTA